MTNADWANKDFYKTLGVAKDASAADIKKAYRSLARDNHPDSHPGNQAAEERFKAVAEAYDVVGDPAKRKQYDELRAQVGGFGPFRPGGRRRVDVRLQRRLRPGRDPDHAAAAASPTCFGGMFGGGGGGARTRTTSQPRRGADIETEATIGFAESIDGVTVSLRLTSDAPCPDCSGTGAKAGTLPRVCPDCEGVGMRAASVGGAFTMNETCPTCRGRGLVVDDPCPTCHGSGRGMSNRTISARIPAGVKDGQKIRLKGKGAAGERGGPAGDLFVTVKVAAHPLFGRRGDNLTLDVPVSFDEAALGAEIKVPTLGGAPVTLKIPPGTPNGRVVPGPRPGRQAHQRRRRSAPPATCWSPSQVQVPAVLDEQGPRRPCRPTGRPPAAPTCGRTSSSSQRERDMSGPGDPVNGVGARPRRAGLRDQRGGRADRPAPADPALLRPARAGQPRPHRRRRPALLLARHRAAPRGRRADLGRHRPRGRAPDPRSSSSRSTPCSGGSPSWSRTLAAADYALHHTLTASSPPRAEPPRGAATPGGQSVTVWRRGRG